MLLFLLAGVGFACSPMPGYVWPTMNDEHTHASVVVVGTVMRDPKVESSDSDEGMIFWNQKSEITMQADVYIKGKGPCTLTVTGFSSSAACGVDAPSAGDRIAVFGCITGDNTLELHNIALHTGMRNALNNDMVSALLGEDGMPNKCTPESALKSNEECTDWDQPEPREDTLEPTERPTSGPGGMTCPKNCKSWFDGCNRCQCNNGVVGGCTYKACREMQEPKCMDDSKAGTCPKDCKRWFDGCNNCSCNNGKVGGCTRKACRVKKQPKCMDSGSGGSDKLAAGDVCYRHCEDGSKPGVNARDKCPSGTKCTSTLPEGMMSFDSCGYPEVCKKASVELECDKGCKSWYDGCNTCQCNNGKIGGCTLMFCANPGEPRCKDDDNVDKPSCEDEDYCCPKDKGAQCIRPRGPNMAKKCVLPNDGVVAPVKCSEFGDSCPEDCSKWFDGCNSCDCIDGKATNCTEKACSSKSKSMCKAWSSSCKQMTKETCGWRDDCQLKGKKCKKKKVKKEKKEQCTQLGETDCKARSDCQVKTKGKKKKFKKCAKGKK